MAGVLLELIVFLHLADSTTYCSPTSLANASVHVLVSTVRVLPAACVKRARSSRSERNADMEVKQGYMNELVSHHPRISQVHTCSDSAQREHIHVGIIAVTWLVWNLACISIHIPSSLATLVRGVQVLYACMFSILCKNSRYRPGSVPHTQVGAVTTSEARMAWVCCVTTRTQFHVWAKHKKDGLAVLWRARPISDGSGKLAADSGGVFRVS